MTLTPHTTSTIPFQLDVKGAETTATELEDGALLLGGWGLRYNENDLEDEGFADVGERLLEGLRDWLKGPAPLLRDHDPTKVLGRVIDAKHVPGEGVYVKAVVDPQPKWSPLRIAIDAIRRGRIAGFSVGGRFDRVQTKAGPRIVRVRPVEWSVTAVPVGGRTTTFEVLAGKALLAPEGKALTTTGRIVDAPADPELATLRAQVDRMEADALGLRFARLNRTVGGSNR